MMINNVFDFGDATAKDIMVPKVDMSFLNVTASYNDMLELYKENKYTRYPVYEETTDNVIGMINVKDLLIYEDKEHFDPRNIMRNVLYTIVLDEYGVTSGMVTMEDLLEEIIGDIRDEYDEDEEKLVTQISDREFVVAGAMSLDDLNDYLELEDKGLKLESEDYNSIGGVIIGLLDHLPEVGEEATTDNGIRLTADSVEKNRINEVHIFLPETEHTETPEEG